MPRPKIYANDAERKAAYIARNARLDVVIEPQIKATIDKLLEQLDTSKNELVGAMLRFALTNHNWAKSGLWLKK